MLAIPFFPFGITILWWSRQYEQLSVGVLEHCADAEPQYVDELLFSDISFIEWGDKADNVLEVCSKILFNVIY